MISLANCRSSISKSNLITSRPTAFLMNFYDFSFSWRQSNDSQTQVLINIQWKKKNLKSNRPGPPHLGPTSAVQAESTHKVMMAVIVIYSTMHSKCPVQSQAFTTVPTKTESMSLILSKSMSSRLLKSLHLINNYIETRGKSRPCQSFFWSLFSNLEFVQRSCPSNLWVMWDHFQSCSPWINENRHASNLGVVLKQCKTRWYKDRIGLLLSTSVTVIAQECCWILLEKPQALLQQKNKTWSCFILWHTSIRIN